MLDRQLHSLRPPLPDVPAVYFVAPTLDNVRRIAQDLEELLYQSYHLNFVEPLSRALLEELAASVASAGTGELIEQARIFVYIILIFNILMHIFRSLTNICHSFHLHLLYSPCYHHYILPHHLVSQGRFTQNLWHPTNS